MAVKYKGQGGLEIEETDDGIALSVNGIHVGFIRGKIKINVGDFLDPEKQYLVVGNYASFPLDDEQPRKCDKCKETATHFESPLGNPDEAALCDKHFKELMDYQNKEAAK